MGSNLGNRERHLSLARNGIEHRIGPIIKTSTIYQSAAWGGMAKEDFLNQVVQIQTKMNPYALLYRTIGIEISQGRQFQGHLQSRHLDIDILYYENLILKNELLTIPHSGIPERRFTLEPLAEIAPQELHPVWRISQEQLLKQCTDSLPVTKL